jgi:pimeloyl-ACP methyl ester carboxylesterase
VGVLAGAPAWAAGTEKVTWGRKVLAVLSRWVPGPLRIGAQAVVGVLRWVLTRGPVERWVEGWLQKIGEKRRAEGKESGNDLPPAKQRGQLMDLVFEGFEQGAGAAVEEARLLSDVDWGFRLEDVDHERVIIWHGAKDVNAPIGMVRWMAERIPNARLKVFEEDSHYSLGEKFDEVLEDLVAEDRKSAGG